MIKKLYTIVIALVLMSCGSDAESASSGENSEVKVSKIKHLLPEEEGNDEMIVVPASDTNKEEPEVVIITEKNKDEAIQEYLETHEGAEVVHLTKEVPVQVQEPVFTEEFKPNHIKWDEVTKKHVSSTGKVNYKGMKADLSKIETYLDHLKNTPPKKDWSKNEKLAYWINLYNASTVYLITSNYPTSSITKLNGGKPWDKKFVKSGTKTYSLNDVENVIVRPRFKDPRIHAALNCAAVSCPKLQKGAFLPKELNAQLDRQTRAWVNDVSKNKLNGNKAQISQIFDWYKVDFKDGVVSFINRYISTGVAVESTAKITYLEYNWGLNE